MKKTLSTFELREVSEALIMAWEADRLQIKVTGKALYNLVGLKRTLENELKVVGDSLTLLATQHGGEPMQNGQFKIPDDKIGDLNKALEDLYKTEVEIEYQPIKISEADSLPISIMEPIFDFLELSEEE